MVQSPILKHELLENIMDECHFINLMIRHAWLLGKNVSVLIENPKRPFNYILIYSLTIQHLTTCMYLPMNFLCRFQFLLRGIFITNMPNLSICLQPETKDSIALFMANTHKTVNEMSVLYLQNDRRYNYTTPKSFLEQINLYRQVTLILPFGQI